jgi:hypothetical protein
MPAMYVLVTMIAALLASVSLWYPSAAIGIGLFRLAGQPTYFTPAGLAPFVGVSILGLFLPAGLLSHSSHRAKSSSLGRRMLRPRTLNLGIRRLS